MEEDRWASFDLQMTGARCLSMSGPLGDQFYAPEPLTGPMDGPATRLQRGGVGGLNDAEA